MDALRYGFSPDYIDWMVPLLVLLVETSITYVALFFNHPLSQFLRWLMLLLPPVVLFSELTRGARGRRIKHKPTSTTGGKDHRKSLIPYLAQVLFCICFLVGTSFLMGVPVYARAVRLICEVTLLTAHWSSGPRFDGATRRRTPCRTPTTLSTGIRPNVGNTCD